LNYRRDDASGHAGRLYDLLAARYGADRVFMDIDAIPLGSEFGETINRAVASCDVLIALIGRDWLEARDEGGHRRLDDPDDFVRREIESALAQGVVVVPASVQGAEIPRAHELPPSLAPLTRRQGFQLSDLGWQDDVDRLIRRLEAVRRERISDAEGADHPAPPRRERPSGRVLGAIGLGFLALLVALVGVLLLTGGDDGGGDEPSSGLSAGGAEPSAVSQTQGTVTLGSDLRIAPSEERWPCTGSTDSPSCSFVLTRLPEVDRLVRAPFDGVVTNWRVYGAGGPVRLIVVRGEFSPGERSSLERVQGSAEEQGKGTNARQRFRTRLKIRRGDGVGMQLSVGAYGNAPYSDGSWLEEWIPPIGTERVRSDESSTQNYELLYNASIERDRDGDEFGDVTQDDCPKDPGRQEGC
jgi:hypothetical protein